VDTDLIPQLSTQLIRECSKSDLSTVSRPGADPRRGQSTPQV